MVLNSLFQTTFFSILFLLCLGMILYVTGNLLLSFVGFHSVNLQFAGALLATLSWVSTCIRACSIIIMHACMYRSVFTNINEQKCVHYNILYMYYVPHNLTINLTVILHACWLADTLRARGIHVITAHLFILYSPLYNTQTSQMMAWTFYEVPEAGSSSSSSDKPE